MRGSMRSFPGAAPRGHCTLALMTAGVWSLASPAEIAIAPPFRRLVHNQGESRNVYRSALNEGAARLSAAVAAHTSKQLYLASSAFDTTANRTPPPSPQGRGPAASFVEDSSQHRSPSYLRREHVTPATLRREPTTPSTERERATSNDLRGSCCATGRETVRQCRAEAIIFGVLLPIAIFAYMLRDIDLDVMAHGGTWMPATCRAYQMVMTHRTLHHNGKFSDQRGILYELEPGWLAEVSLASDPKHPWEAMAFTSVRDVERPRCEGMVGGTLDDTLSSCRPWSEWVPMLGHAGENMTNFAHECFVHRRQQQHVFFNVEEPPSFYGDILLVSVLVLWALCVGCFLVPCPSPQRKHAATSPYRPDLV